jgi:hypothetical protein
MLFVNTSRQEHWMKTRQLIRIVSLAVVFVGGAYLSATPAQAAPATLMCSDDAWLDAIHKAETACGGSASTVGQCVGNTVLVKEIYCN